MTTTTTTLDIVSTKAGELAPNRAIFMSGSVKQQAWAWKIRTTRMEQAVEWWTESDRGARIAIEVMTDGTVDVPEGRVEKFIADYTKARFEAWQKVFSVEDCRFWIDYRNESIGALFTERWRGGVKPA